MCFHCPADLTVESDGADIRFVRIAETEVLPSDVVENASMLTGFSDGTRFLMALQATAYVDNHPVVTETLHGVVESDIPGEVSCAFEDEHAVKSLLISIREKACAKGYLRNMQWVLY